MLAALGMKCRITPQFLKEDQIENLMNYRKDRTDHCKKVSSIVTMDGGELPMFVLEVLIR